MSEYSLLVGLLLTHSNTDKTISNHRLASYSLVVWALSEPLFKEDFECQPFLKLQTMSIKQWERQPAFLNETQLQDPILAIYSSVTGDVLINDRTLLFEVFYAAVGSETFVDYDSETMRRYTYCWERTIVLVEACHRLIELKIKEQFHYSYSGDVTPK